MVERDNLWASKIVVIPLVEVHSTLHHMHPMKVMQPLHVITANLCGYILHL